MAESDGKTASESYFGSESGAPPLHRMNSRVSYFYDDRIGSYYYGQGHPMKPHRLKLTHNLLIEYGLYKKMEVYKLIQASDLEMKRFHSDDYVEFLKRVTPDNAKEHLLQLQKCAVFSFFLLFYLLSVFDFFGSVNLGPYTDCPIFDGLYEYTQLHTGGSIGTR